MAVAAVHGSACQTASDSRDYRGDMRRLVQDLGAYARTLQPGFLVIPQNGHELLTHSGEPSDTIVGEYVAAIDGMGREDLFYGYDADDVPTPADERDRMAAFMDLAETNGVQILVTDYCSTAVYVIDSYVQSSQRGYISFAADHRELDNVPAYPAQPFGVHGGDVARLDSARNFLYLINPDAFGSREAYLNAVRGTDYDLLIVDAFYNDTVLAAPDVASLKTKSGGGSRFVIAYMSIGEAEDYRYYWQDSWTVDPPSWLAGENPNWPGNYKVRYWDAEWRAIIFGNDGSYLKRILDAGFDGVYLDIIDAYEYFE